MKSNQSHNPKLWRTLGPPISQSVRLFCVCSFKNLTSYFFSNIINCFQVQQIEQLEKIFPMLSHEAIKNAIEKSVDVHEAVNILLENTTEEKG